MVAIRHVVGSPVCLLVQAVSRSMARWHADREGVDGYRMAVVGINSGHACGASIHSACRVIPHSSRAWFLRMLQLLGPLREQTLLFPKLSASGITSMVSSFEPAHDSPSTTHSRVPPGSSNFCCSPSYRRAPTASVPRWMCYEFLRYHGPYTSFSQRSEDSRHGQPRTTTARVNDENPLLWMSATL